MKRLQPILDALERLPLRITHPPVDVFIDVNDSATVVFETQVVRYAVVDDFYSSVGLGREDFIEVPTYAVAMDPRPPRGHGCSDRQSTA